MIIEELTQEEINSELWRKLEKHINARITELRIENDYGVSEITTTHLRGEISAYKEMLLLARKD